MSTKRKILNELTRERLLEFARMADMTGLTAKSKAEIVEELASAKRARLGEFLPVLSRDELKAVCTGLDLDDYGREKQVLIDRILGRGGDADLFDAPVSGEEAPPPKGKVEIPREAIKHLEPVEDYRHEHAKRKNIPPAKIAAEGTVPVLGKIEYSYSPRRSPVLRFDATGGADKLPPLLAAARERPLTAEEVRLLADALRNQEPWLEWAGKRESEPAGFAVDPVGLHIHERISAQAIVKVAARKDVVKSLFGDPEMDYHEAVQFYRHDIDWTNRLILGDSLQVMASLAKREDLAGKVQMIYIDPPYGIKFASNFQPEVGKRDVKDKETDLTREAEMVKAYRDTWTLGVHSYLAYLRDRLIVARALLKETGSIFVQISDENLDRIRLIMDDVFGQENFFSLVVVQKTGGLSRKTMPSIADFLLWYAKDRAEITLNTMFTEKELGDVSRDITPWFVDLADGSFRSLTRDEKRDGTNVAKHVPVFRAGPLKSDGANEKFKDYEFEGGVFDAGSNKHWKTNKSGMDRLRESGRLFKYGSGVHWKYYTADYPVTPLTNLWTDTQQGGFSDERRYVVQTGSKVITRCMLMTTNPGDLVLDPTCGSGTTANVAEQWGRRWITIDTSRVAVAIARQRLLTAKFDYYKLRSDKAGPVGGFYYKTVPHITLKSIAQNSSLDPIFAKHAPILETKLKACNTALAVVAPQLREGLAAKLKEKQRDEGKKSITDADRRRWLLPPENRERGPDARKKSTVDLDCAEWYEWEIPFDTDPDWLAELQDAVSAYRAAWRAKMDEVNACIAANADQEELVDQPEVVRGIVRVSGPFTVEAVQPPEMSLADASIVSPIGGAPDHLEAFPPVAVREVQPTPPYEVKNLDAYLEQMVRFLRVDGVRFPDNKQMQFTRLERIAGHDGIHAEGRWVLEGGTDAEPDGRATIAVGFGPQYGPVTAKQVEQLLRSAHRRGYDDLVIAGFSFDGTAQAAIDEDPNPRLRIHRANIRPDINPGMNGLLKQQAGSQLFTVFGQPRTRVEKQGEEYVVTMEGVDIYDPVTNTIRPTEGEKVAAWFIDGDFDGRTFCITQAFFPDKGAWEKLAKALGGLVDSERFEALSGTVSLPFPAGKNKCVAVKVIDPRGNEVMQVHVLARTEQCNEIR